MSLINQMIEELPDTQQKNAIREYSRCVVTAGPGSGKTYRLVLKIAYLLGQVVPALQSIACITYMNEAVREIENRISQLGFEDEQRLFVGTVHKFCITAVILPFKDIYLPEWPAEFRIADEEIQLDLVEKTYQALNIPIPSKEGKLRAQLRNIGQHRKAQLLGATSWDKKLAKFAQYYLRLLREQGLVDFDDIAIESCRLVITEAIVRDYIRSRYSWLIIDEYQDLGQVFNKLITYLVQCTNINFFVVGDANQSIMGFQGADPSYLQKLATIEGVEKVNIQITRRCLPHIVNTANRLLPPKSALIRPLQTDNNNKWVKIKKCPSGIHEQISVITTQIQLDNTQNTPYGEIAVLCRTKDTVGQIADAFSDAKINYAGKEDGRYTRTPLTRWLEDVAAWLREGWNTGTPKFQRIHRTYRKLLENATPVLFADYTELQLQTLFLSTLWDCRQTDTFVSEWLPFITKNLLLDEIATNLSYTEPRNAKAFWELNSLTQPGQKLDNLTIADLALCGRSENSVFLSTLHSSKGLEFEVVIIPDLEQGRLPSWFAKTDLEIAEERRLLYVGITRAKKKILLLYSGFYLMPWGQRSKEGRSQFLDEIMVQQ